MTDNNKAKQALNKQTNKEIEGLNLLSLSLVKSQWELINIALIDELEFIPIEDLQQRQRVYNIRKKIKELIR